MAVTVNPLPAAAAEDTDEVTYILVGSGTTNDGKQARGIVLLDPTTGEPYASGGSGGTPHPATSVSVGTSSTSVLPANPNRRFLVLCNDSTAVIYVDLSGGTATLSTGVRLGSGGGSIMLDRYVPVSAITAIATGAASTLTVQEG